MIPGIDELLTRLIYRFLYTLARLMWNFNRIFLAIAAFVDKVEEGLINNTATFVTYMVNALRVPTVMLLLLAITSIGTWYLLNNVLPTRKWVDPSRLVLYGLLTALFFAAPATYIETLEGMRSSFVNAIDATIIDDGIADLFTPPDTGTGSGYDDVGMPAALPDLNADGAVATFDLVGYLLGLQNSGEIYRSIFPDVFADTYFPDTPGEMELSSEAARNAAIEDANEGITLLFLSLLALPTAIAEHTLWLTLTLVALLLYIGLPIAMMLSFFIFTDSLFANYIRHFIKLLLETFLSTLFAGFAIGIVALASQVGLAVFLAASVVANFIFVWRIIGALKLATTAFDLFGGGSVTGGATPKDARQLATQTAALAGTAGVALAGVGAAAGTASYLSAYNRLGKAIAPKDQQHLFEHNHVNEARIRQLQALAGYSVGKIKPIRRGIETAHEAMTFGRNFQAGAPSDAPPNVLDYLRAGSAASNFGSSPWLAMRMSPSLRQAMDTVGGKTSGLYYDDQAPLTPEGSPLTQLNKQLEQLNAFLGQQNKASFGSGGQRPPRPTPNSSVPDAATGRESAAAEQGGGQTDLFDDEQTFDTVYPASPETTSQRAVPTDVVASGESDTVRPRSRETAVPEPETAFPMAAGGESAAPNLTPITIGALGGGKPHANAVSQTIAGLGSGETAAQQRVEQAVGAQTANMLQSAVKSAGVKPVQTAAQASIAVAEAMATTGMSESDILNAFRAGDAFEQVQTQLSDDTSLTPAQLHAIADVALQPTKVTSFQELAAALGTAVEEGGDTATVAAVLGSPTPNMAALTGEVRGIIQQAQQMGLRQAELRHIAAQLEQNRVDKAHLFLDNKRGARGEKEQFIVNLANLQQTKIAVAQSTKPGAQDNA